MFSFENTPDCMVVACVKVRNRQKFYKLEEIKARRLTGFQAEC